MHMKRIFLLATAIILIVVGLFLLARVSRVLQTSGQGALQVSANVKSNVYLDDQLIGTISDKPLCKCSQNETITEGEYMVKIEPQDTSIQPYTVKVSINNGVLTAVERTFLPGALASAYILTLEKAQGQDAELLVSSLPKDAMVTVDNTPSGSTPHLIEKIPASEHEIEVQKNGYSKKTIRIRTVPEYRLTVDVILGIEGTDIVTTPTPQQPTLSPTGSITSSPSTSQQQTPSSGDMIKIDSPQVGFLRVRSQPTTASTEIDRVDHDEEFELLDERNGWYQIKIDSRTTGWISAQYAEKVE